MQTFCLISNHRNPNSVNYAKMVSDFLIRNIYIRQICIWRMDFNAKYFILLDEKSGR